MFTVALFSSENPVQLITIHLKCFSSKGVKLRSPHVLLFNNTFVPEILGMSPNNS